MPVDARFHSAHLHAVNAHRVLEVAVARQPADDGRRGRDVCGAHGRRRQRHVLADQHRTGGVPGGATVRRHGPHTDPVRLPGGGDATGVSDKEG